MTVQNNIAGTPAAPKMDPRILNDLKLSGLDPVDMNVRPLSPSERAATNVPFSVLGFTIPYYDILGKPVPFYRVKLFEFEPKYKQPKETPNHVYFPRGFEKAALAANYIIVTEGEKKATLATKLGFACCAFGGVDSWRNRIVSLPAESELNQSKSKLQAKVPAGEGATEDYMSPLALGLQALIDFSITYNKTLIIIFDSDSKRGTNDSVQRAAATLGFELRFRGVDFDKIRQVVLPQTDPNVADKISLDDFLMQPNGYNDLVGLIDGCLAKKTAFPRHPNVRDYLNKRLQKPKLSRKEMQQIAISILSELDAGGMRLRSETELQSYYFDHSSHKLFKASFSDANEMTENPFGQFMYKRYGLGAADFRVIQWIGTLFTGEEPVEDVTPHRVFARPNTIDDNVIMQISDGAYVVVDKDGLKIKANGADGILFESGQVLPVDQAKLKEEFIRQSHEYAGQQLPNWWSDVLSQVRLKDKDKQRVVTSLLFYISPWLFRWRGTQLPIEMTLGEAGSGKSTLQELRLMIQTGDPKLRNSPSDVKDWTASVASSGGLHITDNVQLLDKSLRQRLSDEICRIITEPNPTVEMRKYYTNADLIRLPIRCVFGITAISQPFQNQDILQRAVLIELDKAQDLVNGSISYTATWKEQQLNRYGGREAWLAHHLLVLHRFFVLVSQKWDKRYQAKHRLINFEQSLRLVADIFGIPNDWIVAYLNGSTENAVIDADFAFEGLKMFVGQWMETAADPKKPGNFGRFTVQNIAEWAELDDEYKKCEMLINTRKLGKYLKTHKTMVASVLGMYEDGSINNRQRYKVVVQK